MELHGVFCAKGVVHIGLTAEVREGAHQLELLVPAQCRRMGEGGDLLERLLDSFVVPTGEVPVVDVAGIISVHDPAVFPQVAAETDREAPCNGQQMRHGRCSSSPRGLLVRELIVDPMLKLRVLCQNVFLGGVRVQEPNELGEVVVCPRSSVRSVQILPAFGIKW